MQEPTSAPEPQTDPVTPPRSKASESWGFTAQLVKTALTVAVLAFAIRHFVLQPFIVEGSSMHPRFETNDYLLVDKISYHLHQPNRGDIVVFRYPGDTTLNYVKRVIGLPGETVELKDGAVFVVNAEHPKGFQLEEPYVTAGNTTLPSQTGQTSFTVPSDEYFVLGDNRQFSSDSREWGFLPADDVIGRVMIELYPSNRAGFLTTPDYIVK